MKTNNKKTLVVLPAYNEERVIGRVIEDLKNEGLRNIIVVNDGSHDRTAEIAKERGAVVYSQPTNTGLGASLKVGITNALNNGADIIATCDSDGQHLAKDVKRAVEAIKNGEGDVVIGSRFLISLYGMPITRRIGNIGLNIITYLLFGVYSTDTQSGLRAFSREAAEKIKITTNKMEVSSEIISEISKNGLSLKEIPIKIIYTDYSLQKGQKMTNAFKIVYQLIKRKLKG